MSRHTALLINPVREPGKYVPHLAIVLLVQPDVRIPREGFIIPVEKIP
ncbi:MAG: hypothetical protein H6714_04710 [Myxococcales bacterium]|nr:hypothetical protein [Myxococcales bacterium]